MAAQQADGALHPRALHRVGMGMPVQRPRQRAPRGPDLLQRRIRFADAQRQQPLADAPPHRAILSISRGPSAGKAGGFVFVPGGDTAPDHGIDLPKPLSLRKANDDGYNHMWSRANDQGCFTGMPAAAVKGLSGSEKEAAVGGAIGDCMARSGMPEKIVAFALDESKPALDKAMRRKPDEPQAKAA